MANGTNGAHRGAWMTGLLLGGAGWSLLAVGIVLAVLAAGAGTVPPVDRLTAAVPGLLLALSGLIGVTVAQLLRLAVDVARGIRDLGDRLDAVPIRTPGRGIHVPSASAERIPAPKAPATPAELRAVRGGQVVSRPKASDGGGKVHPIFSARSPRGEE